MATSKQSIHNAREAARSTPNIEPYPKKITEVVSENGLKALNPTTVPSYFSRIRAFEYA